VFQRTRRELRLVGTSPLLLPWEGFAAWLERLQAEYNARPHRGLPRHDVRAGAAHMTPAEAWSHDLAAAGFAPLLPSAEEADDLFRPYELRVTRRGEVSLWGRRYFARHLEHLDGQDVLVGYDIHDASRAWVRDLDERLVRSPRSTPMSRPAFPASRVEQAREARAPPREAAADEARRGARSAGFTIHQLLAAQPELRARPASRPRTIAAYQAHLATRVRFSGPLLPVDLRV
jgi:putative transposase